MGRSVKKFKSKDDLYEQMSQMLVPKNILEDFEITDTREYKEYWLIELHEKADRMPSELRQKDDVVLDGYCDPIEMLSHSFVLKPVYLKIYRRRWKESNTNIHYSNAYDLALKGVKMVPEMGIFLKEED